MCVTYTNVYMDVRVCRCACVCVCLCVCVRERIGPVAHLIVIALVFGLEPVDRNQGAEPRGLCLPLSLS